MVDIFGERWGAFRLHIGARSKNTTCKVPSVYLAVLMVCLKSAKDKGQKLPGSTHAEDTCISLSTLLAKVAWKY